MASTIRPHWHPNPIGIQDREFTILGNVMLEGEWRGTFGIGAPETYLIQRGGLTYADLLTEARQLYPEAHAVVNVTVEYKRSNVLYFIHSRRYIIMTGIAIKYEGAETATAPANLQPNNNAREPVFNEPHSIVVDIWKYGRRYKDYVIAKSAIRQRQHLKFTVFGYDGKNGRWVLFGEATLRHYDDRVTINPPGRSIFSQSRWLAIQSADEIEFDVNVSVGNNDVNLLFYLNE